MTTRLALIGGGEVAASYTTVAFAALRDPQPRRAQAVVTSLYSLNRLYD